MRIGSLTLIIVGIGPGASGQVVTSEVPASHAEISVFRQSFHRSVRYPSGPLQNAAWGRYALLVRIGVSEAVALEVEGFAWHPGATDAFPTRDYFDFTLGAGVNASLWQRGPTRLALHVHVHESSYLDQSASRYSKRAQQLLIAVVANHSGRFVRQRVDLWASPALVVDRVFQDPKYDPNDEGISIQNLGAIIGASLLVRSRVRVFGQVTYATFWQGQGGASVVL